MAAFSSNGIVIFRIAFLLGVSFFCMKDADVILKNKTLVAFSQSMELPQLIINKNSAQLGVFSLLFFMQALGDLIPLLEKNYTYFLSLVPIRLTIFFALCFYSFYNKSNLLLHNNVVFSYGFLEIWMNFLLFSSLREERNKRFEEETRIVAEEYYNHEEEEDVVSEKTTNGHDHNNDDKSKD